MLFRSFRILVVGTDGNRRLMEPPNMRFKVKVKSGISVIFIFGGQCIQLSQIL